MLIAAIILSVLLLLALLRIGLILSYNESGLTLWIKIGFLRFRLKNTGDIKKRKKHSNIGDLKPGSISELTEILKIIKETLTRLKRKLLIKKLEIHYISAGSDPFGTALGYGAANAIFGIIVPILERNFNISEKQLSTSADFELKEPKVIANLTISIAVWEGIYVLSALLSIFTVIERKDVQKNGKRTYKQSAGNNDAKDKGDDRS